MQEKNLPSRKSASSSGLSGLECSVPVPDRYIEQALQLLARATARRQVAELVIKALAA
jgi:hypothetical protein